MVVSKNKSEMSSEEHAMIEMQNDIKKMKAVQEIHGRDIKEIQTTLNQHGSDIVEIKATLDVHGNDIKEIKQDIRRLEQVVNRQGVLAEDHMSKTELILEILQGSNDRKPSHEEIVDQLENHELRIELVELMMRKKM